MANTETTIRTRAARTSFIVISVVVGFFAIVNLLATLTPAADLNESIDRQIVAAINLPPDSRSAIFANLLKQQELSLAHKPADPYSWSRLSYMRNALQQGDNKAAFDALRMSDFVSPWEAPQLPERALMWHNYKAAESVDEQAYQNTLWVKAFSMQRDKTWVIAVQNNLTKEVEAALRDNNSGLYDEWRSRELEAAIKN